VNFRKIVSVSGWPGKFEKKLTKIKPILFLHNLYHGQKYHKNCATYVIFQKWPKVYSRPICENSTKSGHPVLQSQQRVVRSRWVRFRTFFLNEKYDLRLDIN
jgi:hypothetical protein